MNGFALTSTASGRTAILLPAANDAVVIRNGTILATGSVTSAAVGGNGTNGHVRRTAHPKYRRVLHETRVESTIDNVAINRGNDAQVTQITLVTTRGELAVDERGLISDSLIDSGGPPTFFSNGTVLSASSSSIIRHVKGQRDPSRLELLGLALSSRFHLSRRHPEFRHRRHGVESCSVENFGRHAIQLGADGCVRDCVVTSTGGGADGISVGNDSIVSDSKVSGSGGIGILAGDGCTIVDSSAAANGGDGIQAGNHATIGKCNARANQGNGIGVGTAGLISDYVVNLSGKKTTPNNAASDGIEISAGRTRIETARFFPMPSTASTARV